MTPLSPTQICSTLNRLRAAKGLGIIQVGDRPAQVLQRSQGGAYLVLVKRRPMLSTPQSILVMLKSLGFGAGRLSPTGFAIGDQDLYALHAGGPTDAAAMLPMNMQFLGLQQELQTESRKFQSLSAASKARHEIAFNSITNTR